MSTEKETPAGAEPTPPRTAPDTRERRGADRRDADRRNVDRRAQRRKPPPLRKELKALLVLLFAALVGLVLFWPTSEPQRMVVVALEDGGEFHCVPSKLASYFANLYIRNEIKEGKGKGIPDRVQQAKINLKTSNLLSEDPDREEALLTRIREMAWEEFVSRAVYTENGKKKDPPAGVDYAQALTKAEWKMVSSSPALP